MTIDPQGIKIINFDETFKVHVKKFHMSNHEKFPKNQLQIQKISNFLKMLKNVENTENDQETVKNPFLSKFSTNSP